MRPPPTPASAPIISRESLVALAVGLMMGQVVAAISVHREGTVLGLVLALMFVVCGSVSLMLVLMSWPGRASAGRVAGVHGWLTALGVGLLLSLQATTLL